jgi:effector-binding domain-containing protein
MPALDQVWALVRAQGVPTGHNVILYHDQVFNLDAGVEVLGPFSPEGDVVPAEVPGGRVASVAHWGPYDQLTLAHTAIARACIAAGLRVAGPNWEVYGDWSDDPAQLRTDVYYLLRD